MNSENDFKDQTVVPEYTNDLGQQFTATFFY